MHKRVSAETIVALAAASADRAAFGRMLLEDLMRHLGADVGMLRIGASGVPTFSGLSPTVVGGGSDPWTRHAAELGPVLAVAARAGVAVDTAVLGERRVRSARYFSEVVRPHGGRDTLYALPSFRERPAACLVLGRCGARGRFRPVDLEEVHLLLPAIALASKALAGVGEQEAPVDLSSRESEIVTLLTRGLRSREIGDALGTSVNTVRNQISRLMARLGVGTRAELVAALTRDTP